MRYHLKNTLDNFESAAIFMKFFISVFASISLLMLVQIANADVSLDALYDMRHSVDPDNNSRNFPVIRLNVFKQQSYGDFFLSNEAVLDGEKNNSSKNYLQVSQSFRLNAVSLWDEPLFALIGYSSGLGVFGNVDGGYYINSKYKLGLNYPFRVGETFCSLEMSAGYINTPKSHVDPLLSLYVGRNAFNNKVTFSNTLQVWRSPRYQENSDGWINSGAYYAWNIETNLWYEFSKPFSIGAFIRTSRNVQDTKGKWTIYPSIGFRYVL